MPFIRQFAHVDIDWFRQTPYKKFQLWLDAFLNVPALVEIDIIDCT